MRDQVIKARKTRPQGTPMLAPAQHGAAAASRMVVVIEDEVRIRKDVGVKEARRIAAKEPHVAGEQGGQGAEGGGGLGEEGGGVYERAAGCGEDLCDGGGAQGMGEGAAHEGGQRRGGEVEGGQERCVCRVEVEGVKLPFPPGVSLELGVCAPRGRPGTDPGRADPVRQESEVGIAARRGGSPVLVGQGARRAVAGVLRDLASRKRHIRPRIRRGGEEKRQRARGRGVIIGGHDVHVDAGDAQICLSAPTVSPPALLPFGRRRARKQTCHLRHDGLWLGRPASASSPATKT